MTPFEVVARYRRRPSPSSTHPAAYIDSAATAALNATRCGACRLPNSTSSFEVAASSTPTGNPQAISAAKLKAMDARGASVLERPGVTTGQRSPKKMRPTRTQGSG
jgi:hypothetical protein